jgi:hypothetical protein
MSLSRASALWGDERANLARVSEDYVRTIPHHSSINKYQQQARAMPNLRNPTTIFALV